MQLRLHAVTIYRNLCHVRVMNSDVESDSDAASIDSDKEVVIRLILAYFTAYREGDYQHTLLSPVTVTLLA